jgi:Flp pilus assembly protein TadG
MKTSLCRFRRNEAGAAAVEFALVIIPFLTLLFGIAWLAVILHTNSALHWAVEHAARSAAMNNAVTQSQISTEINGYLGTLGISSATVSYSVAAGALPVAHITATLSKTYALPLVPHVQINYVADTYVPQAGP